MPSPRRFSSAVWPAAFHGFLEGGVGWAAQLFGDLIEHWERRNAKALERMDPSKLDRKLLMDLVLKYGYEDMAEALRARGGYPNPEAHLTGGRDELDDFAACRIARKEDCIELYPKPYYFGCEADDRMNVCAFSRANPFGAQLNAIYSSDIGHFDVIDMRDPLPEAWELVEDGLITEGQFPRFHLYQRGAAVGYAEPASLRWHGRGQGSRRGARRAQNSRRGGIAATACAAGGSQNPCGAPLRSRAARPHTGRQPKATPAGAKKPSATGIGPSSKPHKGRYGIRRAASESGNSRALICKRQVKRQARQIYLF
jgi:hypothetical protein